MLAPPDVGLYVGGLTPCWPFVSHAAAPDHDARAEAVRRFYTQSTPDERASLLEGGCVAHVVLPPRAPGGWLGPGAPYRPRLEVPGPNGGLAVWSRDRRRARRPGARARRPRARDRRAPVPGHSREPEEGGRDVDDAGRRSPARIGPRAPAGLARRSVRRSPDGSATSRPSFSA